MVVNWDIMENVGLGQDINGTVQGVDTAHPNMGEGWVWGVRVAAGSCAGWVCTTTVHCIGAATTLLPCLF